MSLFGAYWLIDFWRLYDDTRLSSARPRTGA